MGRLFTDLERKIIEMSKEVCRNALVASAAEIKNDINVNICYRVSEAYYSDYDPVSYKRTESLYDAWKITPFLTGDRVSFNLNLDSDRLPQHYSRSKYHQSGSTWISRYDDDFDFDSDDNGRPESAWILKNFFEGIHPIFVRHEGAYFNESIQRSGVLDNMAKYIDIYRRSGKMQKILIKHLKRECKKYK